MRLLILTICGISLLGQGRFNGTVSTTGPVDFSAATSSKPWPSSASAPPTCAVGTKYFNTTTGKDYTCPVLNTWVEFGGSGGGGVTTYSGAINFGSVPDLGCIESNITATGITTGAQLASAWPSGLEAGLVPSARASAADTISVRICNFSGAAVDPANATYTITDVTGYGYLSGSGSINFGDINDGSCATNTLTITGAATGNKLAPTWPAALEAGLVPSIRISAADTATITLCNVSGSLVNPAAGTFGASVIK